MTDIQVFENSEFGKLEVLCEGDKYYFPATECAKVLGYSQPAHAVSRHCPHCMKRTVGVQTGTKQDGSPAYQTVEKQFVTEGDLYRLIVRSKLPKAQEFETWVFDDVLPTIRRHGVYATPEKLEEFMRDPRSIANVFLQLAEERDKNKALTEENKQLAPKANYYDVILQNPKAIPITMIAKDYGMTAPFLNKKLKEFGIQFRMRGTWVLYQKYAQNGYTHTNVFVTSNGEKREHTCWTQKGRRFLYDLLKEHGILPEIEKVS